MRHICSYAMVSLAAVLLATSAAVGQFEIHWWTTDGGGEMSSSGGAFALSSTIGQPDAGVVPLIGGEFALTGGFWVGVGVGLPGDCDSDGDVDLVDYTGFAACLLGPDVAAQPACACYNLDGDSDVDVEDFAVFQDTFTGL